jgi:hypothetical protein
MMRCAWSASKPVIEEQEQRIAQLVERLARYEDAKGGP